MRDPAIRRVPIVIVGAGPTGITAATLLAQQGLDCLLLDRWSTSLADHGLFNATPKKPSRG